MKLKCTCGLESKEFEHTSNIGKMSELSEFQCIWNIGKGLSALWFCKDCIEKIKHHWEEIIKITKTDLINIPRKWI